MSSHAGAQSPVPGHRKAGDCCDLCLPSHAALNPPGIDLSMHLGKNPIDKPHPQSQLAQVSASLLEFFASESHR
jgi:hypothetical protein